MALPIDSYLKSKAKAKARQLRRAPAQELSHAQLFREVYFHFGISVATLLIVFAMFVGYAYLQRYRAPQSLFSMKEPLQLPDTHLAMREQMGKHRSVVQATKTDAMLSFTAVLGEGVGLSTLARRYNLSIGTLLSFNHLETLEASAQMESVRLPLMDGLLIDVGREKSISAISKQYGVEESLLRSSNFIASQSLYASGEIFIPGQSMSPARLQRLSGGSFIYPVLGSVVQNFGLNTDSITGLDIFDKGTLFQTKQDARVYSIADGVILESGHHVKFGFYLMIEHHGYIAFYGYLDSLPAKGKFDKVSMDEPLAGVQARGRSALFYFSLMDASGAVDPLPLLR
jgi:murein DD-endopeptidase MepM/ murein hydrolase activator NlpD